MNKTKRILDELAKQSESSDRPDAKRMRDVYSQIEESIARGVSRKRIYEVLKDEGFAFTYGTFLVTLARLRKENKKGKIPAATTQQGAQAPPPKPPADALARPPGITPALWTEMQQKHKAELRRQRNLRNGETK